MIAETKEDKLLLALLADRHKQCEDKMYPTNSDFLDAREQALAAEHLHNRACFVLWGGYDMAERRCMVFLPDYLAELQTDFSAADAELNPLAVLRATPVAHQTTLSHRDYLGALLALGIKRQKVGDIIVKPEGADILILRDMADYLQLNFTQVGRHRITTEVLPTAAVSAYEPPTKEFSANVPSLRLDSMAAAAFGVSRSLTAEAVRTRLVAVNGLQITKPDYLLSPGDAVTWRGKGKAVFVSTNGTTRKDRIFITIKRYI